MDINNLFYDKVVKIEIGKSYLYDVFVPGTHTFIGNESSIIIPKVQRWIWQKSTYQMFYVWASICSIVT